MPRFSPSRLFLFPILLLVIGLLALSATQSFAKPAKGGQVSVGRVEALGLVTFPTGFQFADTEVGGLSGITYDANRGVYYALSDDRSEFNPSRYYTVDFDLSDGSLDPGDVTFLGVTYLRDKRGATFPPFAIDPEGIELVRPGYMYISTEGDDDTTPLTDPFVNRFNPVGKQTRALPGTGKFLYSVSGNSVRDNLAFESLTATPNRRYLYTASENALTLDGPRSTLADESPSRVLEYDLNQKRAGREFVYMVSPIPKLPDPPGAFADNGLVELQALDNQGTFLAMERSFAVGIGNTVRLFEISIDGATDVAGYDVLPMSYTPMSKAFLADFEDDLGITPDNLEGMTFGPALPDGRVVLIVVSDNNFNPPQITQFIALAVELVNP